MTDPPPPTRAVPAGVLCPSCWYDLTGLAQPGVCPECGRTWTDADARWWGRVLLGLRLLRVAYRGVIAVLLTIGGFVIAAITSVFSTHLAAGIAAVCVFLLGVIPALVVAPFSVAGAWLATIREPVPPDAAWWSRARGVTRFAVVGFLGSVAAYVGLAIFEDSLPHALGASVATAVLVTGLGSILATYVALTRHLTRLRDRLEGRTASDESKPEAPAEPARRLSGRATAAIAAAGLAALVGSVLLPVPDALDRGDAQTLGVAILVSMGIGLLGWAAARLLGSTRRRARAIESRAPKRRA